LADAYEFIRKSGLTWVYDVAINFDMIGTCKWERQNQDKGPGNDPMSKNFKATNKARVMKHEKD
jgi:hypothetical protein